MKERGYTVRVESNYVVVEHRASIRPRTLAILTFLYLVYCLLPPVRQTWIDTVQRRDEVSGCLLLFFLALRFLSGGTWFWFQSGEMFRCDAGRLSLAQRRTVGRWHRRLLTPQGTVLSWTSVFRSKARSYTALQILSGDQKILVLEELPREEGVKVLTACASFGWKVLLPESIPVIDDTPMREDIKSKGWFVNPWRPDPKSEHQNNQ